MIAPTFAVGHLRPPEFTTGVVAMSVRLLAGLCAGLFLGAFVLGLENDGSLAIEPPPTAGDAINIAMGQPEFAEVADRLLSAEPDASHALPDGGHALRWSARGSRSITLEGLPFQPSITGREFLYFHIGADREVKLVYRVGYDSFHIESQFSPSPDLIDFSRGRFVMRATDLRGQAPDRTTEIEDPALAAEFASAYRGAFNVRLASTTGGNTVDEVLLGCDCGYAQDLTPLMTTNCTETCWTTYDPEDGCPGVCAGACAILPFPLSTLCKFLCVQACENRGDPNFSYCCDWDCGYCAALTSPYQAGGNLDN